jgi:molecular chaperone DnaJ
MATPNYYRTLEVNPTATQAEIKQAYRRLAKRFHPDSSRDVGSHEKIATINAAYEVLSDPQSRQFYDQQWQYHVQLEAAGFTVEATSSREQRTKSAQTHFRQQQQTAHQADEQLHQWLNQVYAPVSRMVQQILQSLKQQIDELAADPFDDELMEDFQVYLEECRELLQLADLTFRSIPNPPSVAGVAANLYYCLNQVGDGIEQLEFFTNSYDEYYIHTGQELFRIAAGLHRDAQAAMRSVG